MDHKLLENVFLRQLSGLFRRSPDQVNQVLESDAELVRLPDGSILAVTTDCIAEEIDTGLYHDPVHIGWMTVVVNLSDLAAVGASPLGLLLSESLPAGFPPEKLHAVQQGISEACSATGVFVLGGDTNQSTSWQMGGTAIGLIPASEPIIQRKGAGVGDALYCSGPMGLGSAYAFQVLMGSGGAVVPYRPLPRLKEGGLVRRSGSACIDTSDGFFHALSNLMEINSIGFQIDKPLSEIAHPNAIQISKDKHLPAWIFLAGPHGEFELLFTIPRKNELTFLESAEKMNWKPWRIGVCTAEPHCALRGTDGRYFPVDALKIANSFMETGGDPQRFLTQLLTFETSWQIQQRNG